MYLTKIDLWSNRGFVLIYVQLTNQVQVVTSWQTPTIAYMITEGVIDIEIYFLIHY